MTNSDAEPSEPASRSGIRYLLVGAPSKTAEVAGDGADDSDTSEGGDAAEADDLTSDRD